MAQDINILSLFNYTIKNKQSIILKISAILALTIAFFFNDLAVVFNDALLNETTNYVLIIPFIFVYLIWRKRKMLSAVVPFENKPQFTTKRALTILAGAMLTSIAVMIYWYGSYTFTPIEYHMLTLPIFVTSLVLILFNFQKLRQAAFPIVFLFFLVPPPSEILYAIGGTLSKISSTVSSGVVNLIGIPTNLITEYGNPLIILTRPDGTSIQFSVDIACSGVYSLIAFAVFAVFVAFLIREGIWKKIALIAVGIPIIYALNVFRITMLLLTGYQLGESFALQTFHLLGGWVLIFIGTLLLFAVSEKILKAEIFAKSQIQCPECDQKKNGQTRFCLVCGRILKTPDSFIRRSDVIKIVALILVVATLLSIQAPAFASTRSPIQSVFTTSKGQAFSTEAFPKISGYNLSYISRDTAFEALAKSDLALTYLYNPAKGSTPIWLSFEAASTRSSLHRWEVCLINYPTEYGSGPDVVQLELSDVKISENPPIISRFFVFKDKLNVTNVVLYWYESSVLTINQTSQQKYMKLSLVAYPQSLEELPIIKNNMLSVAKAIADYWQPIKFWSSIALLISQNGATFSFVATIGLAVTLIVYSSEDLKQKRANKNAYKKLSKQNQQLIDAIQEVKLKTHATLSAISQTYQEITNKSMDGSQIFKRLEELQQTGIIINEIRSELDTPVSTWKTQMPQPLFKKWKNMFLTLVRLE